MDYQTHGKLELDCDTWRGKEFLMEENFGVNPEISKWFPELQILSCNPWLHGS